MKKLKIALGVAFLAGGLAFANSGTAAEAATCVYGSERVYINGKVECLGSTANLCEGGTDCPVNET